MSTSSIAVDHRGVVVVVSGEVSGESIRSLMGELAAHPGFDPSLPTLWDFSESSGIGSVTRQQLRGALATVADLRKGARRPRVALVAPRDVDYGVARMFEAMAASLPQLAFSVFRDLAAAEQWVFQSSDPDRSDATA